MTFPKSKQVRKTLRNSRTSFIYFVKTVGQVGYIFKGKIDHVSSGRSQLKPDVGKRYLVAPPHGQPLPPQVLQGVAPLQVVPPGDAGAVRGASRQEMTVRGLGVEAVGLALLEVGGQAEGVPGGRDSFAHLHE